MAGLLEGVLPAVYSYGNTMQRKLKGLLADPLGTVGLGVTRAGEDQQQLVNLAKDAGYMPGSRSVLATPQQKALAQALLAKQATDMGAGMMQAATVWHGSPHKFDKFDSSKIGTGEGAQAYGHGLYLADSPGVADSYAKKLSGDSVMHSLTDKFRRLELGGKPLTHQIDEMDELIELAKAGDQNPIKKFLGDRQARWKGYTTDPTYPFRDYAIKKVAAYDGLLSEMGAGKALEYPQGSLYKVDLPDPLISRMLDWDKPLHRQVTEVRKAVRGLVDETLGPGAYGGLIKNRPDIKDLQNNALESLTQAQIAEALRQRGVPGIRYLDGGSRGAGAGTSNYVVFPGEESALTILERNGSPVNALVQALRGPR